MYYNRNFFKIKKALENLSKLFLFPKRFLTWIFVQDLREIIYYALLKLLSLLQKTFLLFLFDII